MNNLEDLKPILFNIYGDKIGTTAFFKILPLIQSFEIKAENRQRLLSEENIILITYADSLVHPEGKESSLKILHAFANSLFKDVFTTIHILPFFPYSSDDGFSIMDFFAVNPGLGSWEDISQLGMDFNLMFDYVVNHVSAQSQWFKDYLSGKKEEIDLAIEVNPSIDLSMVTRPRALPLLTEFNKNNHQTVHVWTTFSEDQVDLNYKSLDVLYKMISVLLFYVQKGATILRLDAIAYLWKEIGTPCIHLPQTHEFIKLLRKILDMVAPSVMILTETNVPHEENISYLGNGHDEAQMVYNFTLPPLLLYCFLKQDATLLNQWAKTWGLKGESTTFLNFTASHDGIGVRPLEGILPRTELDWLANQVKENQGNVSYKQNPDGSQSPYELNINYVSAMAEKNDAGQQNQIRKFLASQAIQYSLPGIPATYIHSVLGSQNWIEGVKQTHRFRTINREKLNLEIVINDLNDPDSFRSQIFFPYLEIIKTRKKHPAFHPKAAFKIYDFGPELFGIERKYKNNLVLSLTNMTSKPVSVTLPGGTTALVMEDLISGKQYDSRKLTLGPFAYGWFSAKDH